MSNDKTREIIKHISDAALELAFIRHDLASDEFDESDYPDVGGMRQREQAREQWWESIKEDTLNCLTGDDTGCLDPEELDESNCELLWLEAALTTIRQEERRAAFRDAMNAVKLLWTTNKGNSYNGTLNDAVRALEAAETREDGDDG